MDYSIETLALDKLETDCIIIGIYEHQQLSPSAALCNSLTNNVITQLIERGDISGKNAETLLINYIPESTINRILVVGLGEKNKITAKLYRKALASAISTIKSAKIKSACCSLIDVEVKNNTEQWKARQIIEIFHDAIYQYQETKSSKESKIELKNVSIIATDDTKPQAELGLQQGVAIAQGIELTKFLADLPGNIS